MYNVPVSVGTTCPEHGVQVEAAYVIAAVHCVTHPVRILVKVPRTVPPSHAGTFKFKFKLVDET